MEAKWSELFKRVPREEASAFRHMSDDDKISFLKSESVPSKNLCLLLGLGEIVHDYPHQSVYHYEGNCEIQMDNGSIWTAEGIPPDGAGGILYRQGYIQLTREPEQPCLR